MTERTLRHRGEERVPRILNDGLSTQLLDRRQPGGAIVEVSRENHANGGRPKGLCGGPEQRIDRRTKAVFFRTFGRSNAGWLDHQMAIWGREVDGSSFELRGIP